MRCYSPLASPLAAAAACLLSLGGCGSLLTLTPSYLSHVAEVDRLCAKDGGIRIYETIPISKPFKLVEDRPLPDYQSYRVSLSEDGKYRYVTETTMIRPRDGWDGGLYKGEARMWRTSDEKLLAKGVTYSTSSGEHISVPGYRSHGCAEFKNHSMGWLLKQALYGIGEKQK